MLRKKDIIIRENRSKVNMSWLTSWLDIIFILFRYEGVSSFSKMKCFIPARSSSHWALLVVLTGHTRIMWYLICGSKKVPYNSFSLYITNKNFRINAGHYVPQLADLVYERNKDKKANRYIKLKGFIVSTSIHWLVCQYCWFGFILSYFKTGWQYYLVKSILMDSKTLR